VVPDTYAASIGGAAAVGYRDLAAEVVKGRSPMRVITEVTNRPFRNRAIVRASVKRSAWGSGHNAGKKRFSR
jgi:hypothetical protein